MLARAPGMTESAFLVFADRRELVINGAKDKRANDALKYHDAAPWKAHYHSIPLTPITFQIYLLLLII